MKMACFSRVSRLREVLMETDQWVPILEYAASRGVSLSTLRRHIKANKIRFQKVNGRYLVLDEGDRFQPARRVLERPQGGLKALQRIALLEKELSQAREQIAELQMLVKVYEEKSQMGEIETSSLESEHEPS